MKSVVKRSGIVCFDSGDLDDTWSAGALAGRLAQGAVIVRRALAGRARGEVRIARRRRPV